MKQTNTDDAADFKYKYHISIDRSKKSKEIPRLLTQINDCIFILKQIFISNCLFFIK